MNETVIIDDMPADDKQRAELLKFYEKHGIRPSSKPIKHYTWHYSKKRATELNYV